MARCSPHVLLLLEQTRQICEANNQFAKLAGLLITDQDVFSDGDIEVRRALYSAAKKYTFAPSGNPPPSKATGEGKGP